MAGCQGAQPGPCSAPWWLPPSPAGRAAARLAAGAGCAGCWHKPPPADGVNPLRLPRNLGASPRVRRVVFRPVLPIKVLRPWAGIEPATTAFRRGSTRLSYQWWRAWSRTRHFLSEWSPRPCRYPAFAVCGMQDINRTRRPRMPGTGGANGCPNPGLRAVTACAGCLFYCQICASLQCMALDENKLLICMALFSSW